MFLIFIVIIALLVIGIYLLHQSFDEWGSVFVFMTGLIAVIMGIIMAISYAIVGYSWFAAEYQARLINREFGTEYTQEEVFWASGVIDEIRELQRKRIEVNGNVMGHGEDPNKEE